MNKPILSHNEMQEMLPDYIFENLTISEAELFENSLNNYPDIETEVKEAKAVFSKINKIDLKKDIADKSRNISVKVNHKLNFQNSYSRFKTFSRLILPTAALAIIVGMIFMYDNPIFYNRNKHVEISKSNINKDLELSNAEKLALIEIAEEYPEEMSQYSINQFFHETIVSNNKDNNIEIKLEEAELNALKNKINQFDKEHVNQFLNLQTSFGIDLYEGLENLTEIEFQNLLEELENEKFI